MIISCHKKDTFQLLDVKKDLKKKELIFAKINKSWVFKINPNDSDKKQNEVKWNEWRIFLNELSIKPKSTIGAFQLKSKNLSKKVSDLLLNIPEQFNVQAIISRVVVLQTKINMLELYINLTQIPDAKVITLVSTVNIEVAALQAQIDEIMIKNKIKVEDGEQDLIMMLDTARALPNIALPVQ
jgi:hypothetical protein